MNGILIKNASNKQEITLNDDINCIFGNAFNDNVEIIHGSNVVKIHGTFKNKNLRVLDLPKLKYSYKLDLPKLDKLVISDSFKAKNINTYPNIIVINNNKYEYSNDLNALFKQLDTQYKLNCYKENTNIIYMNNGEIKYSFGNKDIVSEIVNLNKVLSIVPKEIMEEISNYKIFITDIYLFQDNIYIPGITYSDIKTAIICMSGMFEIIHEIGHMYDDNKNISDSEEFDIIYNEEKSKIYSLNKTSNVVFEHITSSKKEFFAEIFKNYIVNKDNLELECPLTKVFLDNILGEKYKKI